MKELVCVTPDGKLEVWVLHSIQIRCADFTLSHHWQVISSEDRLSGFWDYNIPEEFWGREELGEL